MIRILLIQPRPRNSSDPVFWALREINLYRMELYKIRKEARMSSSSDLSPDLIFMEIKNRIQDRIAKLEDLISIGMDGKIKKGG